MCSLARSRNSALERSSRRFRRPYHGLARAAALSTLLGAGSLLGTGCGASYQAVYEGEVRFEHCHRLDMEPSIPLTQRRECWREWTKFYTYGQTRDRVEYALRRQRELTARIENPGAAPEPSLSPPNTVREPLAAPAPTNPFAPPPHVDDGSKQPPPASVPPSPSNLMDLLTSDEHPQAQPCLIQCLVRWQSCTNTCDPKDDQECRQGCDAAFRDCGLKCLKP